VPLLVVGNERQGKNQHGRRERDEYHPLVQQRLESSAPKPFGISLASRYEFNHFLRHAGAEIIRCIGHSERGENAPKCLDHAVYDLGLESPIDGFAHRISPQPEPILSALKEGRKERLRDAGGVVSGATDEMVTPLRDGATMRCCAKPRFTGRFCGG
jgi:hypothetical protein